MFDKILIANRGEIACRIMETAHKMGVKTVAIYSDADAHSKHVAMAGEAWRVGPPAVAESYLLGDKIIEIAKASGAQAIHPGYGFLSESPDFAEKVETSGLRFIGPSSSAIRAMGLKDAAKELMTNSGVPVVPGYHGSNQDVDFLAKEAENIGYPVLIKARAGGGGKGMRKVDKASDFHAALEGAQREGLSAFGDAHCLIEKWITTPRHIEIQVFGDDHGNAIHMFERDCSLQRRHQKVIEEAPAPGMTEEMRAAMGEAAVRCAKAIGYSGAGTIEFIVDGSDGLSPDRFWFMEMNTRLQVEHPVTEMITGLDLVEWQLRVADGEPLPATQDSLTLNGHAFEARIYAEDVPAGFLPMTGSIDYLSMSSLARVDSGIREGDTITPWYDPIISKLIVWGATREIALNRMSAALAECNISGTVTNLPFLSALCAHEEFKVGNVDTGLIERDLDDLIVADDLNFADWALAAIVAGDMVNDRPLAGWSMWAPLKRSVWLKARDEQRELLITQTGAKTFTAADSSENIDLQFELVTPDTLTLTNGGQRQSVSYFKHEGSVSLFTNGDPQAFDIITGYSIDDATDSTGNEVLSPMPGIVKVLNVAPQSEVNAGDTLIIIEAMKMEHSLTVARDGIISDVLVEVGQQVEAGEVLLTLEDPDA
ncbi:MAG: acetyl/propionyl/methylcrotonyl-CoA carboxylase subunit alpha [Rhodobacteraceae bacterium]|nr:acetyl/propionyl/methylcrotonyl-CoA carboxylase subunit alpha [Paracoccaceae bacterium]